jgi:phage-related protein
MTIASYDPRTTIDRSRIGRWLLGKTQYKALQIVADDMMDVYFNVIFEDAGNFYSGNIYQGVELSATCDAPWAWTFPQTKTISFNGDVLQNYNLTFYNDSDDEAYYYPEIGFTVSNNVSAGDFTLTNITDSSRAFTFTGLDLSEEIVVDNDKKIITSNYDNLRLGNFNKNWFRLLQGNNSLNIQGYLDEFYMTYSFARIIGG